MKLITVDKKRFMEHDGKRVSLFDSEWDHIERLTGTRIPEYIGDVVLNRLRDWSLCRYGTGWTQILSVGNRHHLPQSTQREATSQ